MLKKILLAKVTVGLRLRIWLYKTGVDRLDPTTVPPTRTDRRTSMEDCSRQEGSYGRRQSFKYHLKSVMLNCAADFFLKKHIFKQTNADKKYRWQAPCLKMQPSFHSLWQRKKLLVRGGLL